uniref:30S ribosomal protein S18 n=1 Tax=Nephromyces sp. ex Molgula occidentalis TaxID=2544991 RepID=A0A5C1H7W7_9APIC|nr:hypothetical protein [Nephromyces sp. ex Molgula occidentalis]
MNFSLKSVSYLQNIQKVKSYLYYNNKLKSRQLTGLKRTQYKFISKLIKQYRILGLISFTNKKLWIF